MTGRDCVCNVCTCGRHKCLGNTPAVSCPFEGHSEYHKNFKGHIPTKQDNFAPKLVPLNGGRFEGITESKQQYVEKNSSRAQPIVPKKNSWQPDAVPFEGSTTTQRDFVPHNVEARLAKPAAEWKSPGGEIGKDTTSRADYKAWDVKPVHQREKAKYTGPSAKFEGVSSQKQDFQAKEIPTKFVKAKEVYVAANDERDFRSVTQTAYIPHSVKSQRVIKDQRYQPNPEKFEGTPHYKVDFQAWKIDRPAQRPPAVAQVTAENRDFGTSNAMAYVSHDGAARTKSYKPELQPPPAQRFDGRTTHEDDFKKWPVPAPPKKHETPYEKNPNLFQGTSETKNQFIEKWVPHHVREQVKYQPTGLKFEGESTAKYDYAAKPIPERFNRPKENFVSPSDDRNFSSETKNSYVPKAIDVCPVLKRQQEGRDKGTDGHLYYAGKANGIIA